MNLLKIVGLSQKDHEEAPCEKIEEINSSLEDILAELQRYGEPVLGMYSSDGWHCSIKIRTAMSTATFKVTSKSYDERTPLIAAQQCLENCKKAIHLAGGIR